MMSSTVQPDAVPGPIGKGLRSLRPLLGELNNLKRIRVTGSVKTIASSGFSRSWRMLIAGESPDLVARREVAHAIASARLGGIDHAVLRRSGLDEEQSLAILQRSFDSVAEPLDRPFASALRSSLGLPGLQASGGELPWFVAALADQPRAGATRPGRPRLVLEPPESHAEHCYLTAIYAVLVGGPRAPVPALPFLAGLAHHLHNAILPDSGFAGEAMLGEELRPIIARLNAEAITSLPVSLAGRVRTSLGLIDHAETPEAQAFHAADVLDRVLQMEHYAKVASFTTDVALGEMELVHDGPLQAFQYGILRDSGLLS